MKNIRSYNTLCVELCIQSCTYFLIIYNQGMTIIQRSRTALEYDKILAELSNYAKLEQSKQLCLELTPLVRFEDIETALKAGMSTHIGKPFDIKELYKIISLELIKE